MLVKKFVSYYIRSDNADYFRLLLLSYGNEYKEKNFFLYVIKFSNRISISYQLGPVFTFILVNRKRTLGISFVLKW